MTNTPSISLVAGFSALTKTAHASGYQLIGFGRKKPIFGDSVWAAVAFDFDFIIKDYIFLDRKQLESDSLQSEKLSFHKNNLPFYQRTLRYLDFLENEYKGRIPEASLRPNLQDIITPRWLPQPSVHLTLVPSQQRRIKWDFSNIPGHPSHQPLSPEP